MEQLFVSQRNKTNNNNNMKVKELKKLLENVDDELGIFIQTKGNNAPCLYGVSRLDEKEIAVQSIKGQRYVAFGDVVPPHKSNEPPHDAFTCFGERIHYEPLEGGKK